MGPPPVPRGMSAQEAIMPGPYERGCRTNTNVYCSGHACAWLQRAEWGLCACATCVCLRSVGADLPARGSLPLCLPLCCVDTPKRKSGDGAVLPRFAYAATFYLPA